MRKPVAMSLIGAGVLGLATAVSLLVPRQRVVVHPGDDLQAAVDAVAPGGTVVLQPGRYLLEQTLHLTRPGITLKATPPRAARLVSSPQFAKHPKTHRGQLIQIDAPQVTLQGLVLQGHFVPLVKGINASDTKDAESASHGLVIDNCEVFHFAHHAIDIDGDDAVVRNCSIYENLWTENGVRHDAHGVVTTNALRLTIDNCIISNCSGDCVQGERGAWDQLTIKNCDLSNSPLARDVGGFKQGTYPGENAFDSKHIWGSRGRVTIFNCRLHGFRTRTRVYTSAVVLKENVDAVIDSCDIYDSTIGLRLRGFSQGMAMWPVVMNCVIGGNDLAFRLEDRLQKFRLLHCTIYNNKRQTVWAPGGGPWRGNWDNSQWALVNNLWIAPETVPEIATRADLGAVGNLVVPRSAVDDRLVPRQTLPGSELPPVVDRWYEPTGRVLSDRRGASRSTPAQVGAFE